MVYTSFINILPHAWRRRIFQSFLTRLSSQYIDGTVEGGDILRKVYPSHLYDPMRRSMAVELGGKEIAKILDAENNRELSRIRRAVNHMYDERDGVYAPIHDFWSFVEMVLHIKKKELPELITAENIHWSENIYSIDDLEMTWMPFLERNPAIFGPKPWKIADLRRIFKESPEILREAKQDQIEAVGMQQHKFRQSDEPITLIDRGNGLEIVDGNGRMYHALLANRKKIRAYVGRLKGVAPSNYWVSSGAIKQLCVELRGYSKIDEAAYKHGIHFLRAKLSHNRTALINYQLYLRNDFPEFEPELNDILPAKS